MKKRLHILFMALLAMAVLGGCGADGTGASSEDTSSKEQNVQETEISEIIRSLHWHYPMRQKDVRQHHFSLMEIH